MRAPVDPRTLISAADFVAGELRPAVGRDWGAPAGSLECDVRTTVAHATTATARYQLHLASRTARFVEVEFGFFDDASTDDLLYAMTAVARGLAATAASSSPGARAYHRAGMADAEGFLAMACCEVVVHGWDAAQGLGVVYDPPEDVCRRTLARLFPWAPTDTPTWSTLLWVTGRGELEGQPPVSSGWSWCCAPLEEWNGSLPTRSDPPAEYRLDPETGRWLPIR